MYLYQNKNRMKNVFLILISIFISLSAYSQNNVCKSMCTTDPVVVEEEKIHYIFTGSDTTGLNVKSTKITIMEGRKELVKRRKSGDCLSPNPADCMVEVLEEIPLLQHRGIADQIPVAGHGGHQRLGKDRAAGLEAVDDDDKDGKQRDQRVGYQDRMGGDAASCVAAGFRHGCPLQN